MTRKLSAAALLEMVVDPGTFTAWDTDVVSNDPLTFHDAMPYAERLRLSRERTGVGESVVTGRACIDGIPAVFMVGEFGFLAGTMGVATAERVLRAFDRATQERLPMIAMPISGGTRMQEGVAGFIQMAACAAAARRHRDAGLLYVAYLRNPTTGGVLASWASLPHVKWAEPGALLGLTGPRVMELLTGHAFTEGIQRAEHLSEHGVIDDVVAVEDLRGRLAQLLPLATSPCQDWTPAVAPDVLGEDAAVPAWDAVQWSRRTDRPGVRELLDACGAELIHLRGDGAGEDDPGCLVALTRLCGMTCVVVGHDRVAGERGASLGAAAYREAQRGMALAGELGVPLVTIIDTAGAAMTPHDEEGGLAASIAGCLAELSVVRVPTLAVLLGEGTGGGAIAFLPADRILAAEHSWLSPIAPEGASAILYRTTSRAAEVAASQSIASTDLRRLGIVDVVVPDADADAPARMAAVVHQHLVTLSAEQEAERLDARRRRYRHIAR